VALPDIFELDFGDWLLCNNLERLQFLDMLCSNIITCVLVTGIREETRQITQEILASLCLAQVFKGFEPHCIALGVLGLKLRVFAGVVLSNLDGVAKNLQIGICLHKAHFLYFFEQFVPTILRDRLTVGILVLLIDVAFQLLVFLLVNLQFDWVDDVCNFFLLNLMQTLLTLAALSLCLLHAEDALELDRSELALFLKHVSDIIRIELANEVVLSTHRLDATLNAHSLLKLDFMLKLLGFKVSRLVETGLLAGHFNLNFNL
jgi:hypothetical protein